MAASNWVCPYCDRPQTATNDNRDVNSSYLSLGKGAPTIGSYLSAIRCLNPDCGQVTVDVTVGPWRREVDGCLYPHFEAPALYQRRIMPEGKAKPQPDYIPRAIRDDYREACLIRELSPKASATLARRCLQGMIRDFAKPNTKSDRLFDEIKALELAIEDGSAPREVSVDSVAALTAVRKVGNIGAHMEADVDVIVDVDADEAQILIELIESLLQDWYVERHKRQQRFALTTQLGTVKEQQIKDARAGQKALAAPANGPAQQA